MSKKSLIWKIPCTVLGVVLGIVLILLIAITVVLTTPSARIGLALRSRSSDEEEEPEDTTSTPMSFELPDGEIRNFHLLLNPMGLGLDIGSLSTDAVADVSGSRYCARSIESVDPEDYALLSKFLGLTEDLYDGIINNPYFARQIALGTGTGVRLDLDGLVIRLDLGVGIHAPYQTYRYTTDFTPDLNSPINTYFNMPSVLDALRLNFGIGYPF